MALLNFPNTRLNGSPLQNGDEYTGDNGVTYIYNNGKWIGYGPIQGDVNIGTVTVSDTAPTATTGTQWFDTVEGHTYVATGGVWLDTSPTQIPSPETYLDDITVDGSTLYINSSTLTINTSGTLLVNGSEVIGSGGGSGWQLTSSTAVVSLGSTGTLTLPGGSTISETTTTTIISPPGASAGQSFVIRPTSAINTESSHIHLVSGNPTTVDLYLGDDDQYVKIEKNAGNVVVGTNSTATTSTWTFGTDGVLTLSTASTILGNSEDPNVYIETLTTSTTNTWTFAADGSTTLPKDGTINGYYRPHIGTKLLVPLNALGDDVRYSPGILPNPINSSTNLIAAGWNIVDKDGLTAVVTEMYYAEDIPPNNRVIYSGTLGSNPYPITFTSPDYIADVTSNITIVTTTTGSNTSTWTFAADGSTTFPIGVSIDEYFGSQFPRIVADTGKAFSVQGYGNTGSVALQWAEAVSTSSQIAQVGLNKFGDDGLAKVTLTAGTSTNAMKVWKFAADGSLTLPGALVKSTVAKTGVILPTTTGTVYSLAHNSVLTGLTDAQYGPFTLSTVTFSVAVTGGTINNFVNVSSTASVTINDVLGTIDSGVVGGTTGTTITITVSSVVQATPTALDLTKSVNKLTNGDYTLADGVEGQIVYLVRQTGSTAHNVTVANVRLDGTVYTDVSFTPFTDGTDPTNMATLIFTDSAWQSMGGFWNLT